MYKNATLTLSTLPKRFIDATREPDPYREAEIEAQGATKQ